MSQKPLISVVIPTYKRLGYLQTAIRSVLDQSFTDWELIVSDDETPPCETWKWLQSISSENFRIRTVQHWNGQGQVENTNFAMAQAKGEWIKLLHDDDRLLPGALETLFEAAKQSDDRIVLITTRVCKNEQKLKSLNVVSPLPLIRYAGNEAILRMYLQEESGGTVPSSMMIRTNLLKNGVRFEKLGGLPNIVDAWFKFLLLKHGDLLHVDQFCVFKSSKDSKSITNTTNRFDLDREMELLRDMILPHVDPAFNLPSIDVVKGKIRLIRSLHRLSRWHPVEAGKMAISVRKPRSWWLTLRWFLEKIRRLNDS